MVRSRQAEKAAPKGVELRKQRRAPGCRSGARRPDCRRSSSPSGSGLKYYTFISQIENGFGRVPSESMEGWARALGIPPAEFARQLLAFYEPELHKLLFEVKS